MGLSRRMKAGYGVAEFGLAGAELLLQLYLLEFYVRGAGLSPLLAGTALALAILWDAVTDPVMGSLLDRTRTPLGRFIPYLTAGALLSGIGLAAVFHPPLSFGQAGLFLYLLISYSFLNTGMTVLGVPHMALGGVLSADTHERTELYGWRLVFGTLGLFAGILSPLVAETVFGSSKGSGEFLIADRSGGSLLMVAGLLLSAAVTVAAIWNRARSLPVASGRFTWQELRRNTHLVLKNPVFIPFFGAFLIIGMARSLNASLALPYYKDSLRLSEAQVQGPVLSTFALAIVLSGPFWVKAGRFFGKRSPAFMGMLALGVMSMLAYPLFPQGSLAGPILAAVVGGFLAGAVILVESLLTDIADEDFSRTGEEREGLYFGFWRMGQKVARSLTLGMAGLLLWVIGYEESVAVQSEGTARSLAWLFGLGTGGLFVAASLVFRSVPLSRERVEEIQRSRRQRIERVKETQR